MAGGRLGVILGASSRHPERSETADHQRWTPGSSNVSAKRGVHPRLDKGLGNRAWDPSSLAPRDDARGPLGQVAGNRAGIPRRSAPRDDARGQLGQVHARHFRFRFGRREPSSVSAGSHLAPLPPVVAGLVVESNTQSDFRTGGPVGGRTSSQVRRASRTLPRSEIGCVGLETKRVRNPGPCLSRRSAPSLSARMKLIARALVGDATVLDDALGICRRVSRKARARSAIRDPSGLSAQRFRRPRRRGFETPGSRQPADKVPKPPRNHGTPFTTGFVLRKSRQGARPGTAVRHDRFSRACDAAKCTLTRAIRQLVLDGSPNFRRRCRISRLPESVRVA